MCDQCVIIDIDVEIEPFVIGTTVLCCPTSNLIALLSSRRITQLQQ